MGIFVEIKSNKYYIFHLIALFNLVCTGYNEGENNASYIKPNNVGCGKYDSFMLLLFSGGLVMAAQLKEKTKQRHHYDVVKALCWTCAHIRR